MTTQPEPVRSIHDRFTFYLSPVHLEEGKKYPVTIAQALIKPVFNSITQREQDEIVVHFSDARRSLKCNKTQVEKIWDITDTDDLTKWAGAKIILERVPTKRGGKYTINISAPEK